MQNAKLIIICETGNFVNKKSDNTGGHDSPVLPLFLYNMNQSFLDLLAPVLLALTNVSLVAELSHLLCLCEELVGLLRECLLY